MVPYLFLAALAAAILAFLAAILANLACSSALILASSSACNTVQAISSCNIQSSHQHSGEVKPTMARNTMQTAVTYDLLVHLRCNQIRQSGSNLHVEDDPCVCSCSVVLHAAEQCSSLAWLLLWYCHACTHTEDMHICGCRVLWVDAA